MISKQKEQFNELADERLKKITELDEKVNYDNLIYKYKSSTADIKFDKFDNTFSLLNKIRDVKISLNGAKNDQENFKGDFGEIKRRNKQNISKEQKNALYNIDMLYKARKEVIKFFDVYSSMVSEAKNRATKGAAFEILTPKQMLQRLAIALA